jgi:hypothetical protein
MNLPGSYIASSSCVLQAGDGNRRRQLWLISSIGQGDEKPSLCLSQLQPLLKNRELKRGGKRIGRKKQKGFARDKQGQMEA